MSDAEREAVSSEVHRLLEAKLPRYNGLTQWIHGTPEQTIIDAQNAALKVREWATALPRGLARSEYLGWIDDYYLAGYREALHECRTHEKAREHQIRDAELSKRWARAAELRGSLPKPPEV